MVKFKVIKKYIRGATGEEIKVGTIIDVEEDKIKHFKKIGIINKPVKEEKVKKKKE